MAREFSKSFYKSTVWKQTREYIFDRDNGLCQDCLNKGMIRPGKEVHHKIFLTIENINDTAITLGEDNLILLCKECHHKRHNKRETTREGLVFNERGELVSEESNKMCL